MKNISHDSETPALGKQVITACAFIHHNFNGVESLFLPKRAKTKKFLPDIYELPGGHINFGEDIVEGLKREIMEEFQMNIKVGDPFFVFTYNNKIKGSHSIEIIYFVKFLDPIENIKIHEEDHSGFIWISESEINKIAGKDKNLDDPEIKAITRGFALLAGKSIKFS